jgi:prepilin-type processing-associated H-X9-DG protein/prepilin-type N-terminal cleavage/methylation domain-containing protein
MQNRRHRGGLTARSAFTLVELLVVIGIIGILVAILLPTVAGVNRQARQVKCSSNLRQIATASLMRGQERRGWLALSGLIVAPPGANGAGGLPAGLNDSEQRRYTYAYAPSLGFAGGVSVVPYPAAIAPYLSFKKSLSYNDWNQLDQELNDRNGVWKLFQCPATNSFDKFLTNPNSNDTTPVDQGTMFALSFGTGSPVAAWSTNTDYAMNEGLLGFHYDRRYEKRYLGGCMSKVRNATQVVLITDAKLRADPAFSWMPDPWIVWSPRTVFIGPVTLADALLNNGKAIDVSSFDLKRHDKKMNIAFLDGHVASYRITAGDLSKCYLLPPP